MFPPCSVRSGCLRGNITISSETCGILVCRTQDSSGLGLHVIEFGEACGILTRSQGFGWFCVLKILHGEPLGIDRDFLYGVEEAGIRRCSDGGGWNFLFKAPAFVQDHYCHRTRAFRCKEMRLDTGPLPPALALPVSPAARRRWRSVSVWRRRRIGCGQSAERHRCSRRGFENR